jgi:hypothetical protein
MVTLARRDAPAERQSSAAPSKRTATSPAAAGRRWMRADPPRPSGSRKVTAPPGTRPVASTPRDHDSRQSCIRAVCTTVRRQTQRPVSSWTYSTSQPGGGRRDSPLAVRTSTASPAGKRAPRAEVRPAARPGAAPRSGVRSGTSALSEPIASFPQGTYPALRELRPIEAEPPLVGGCSGSFWPNLIAGGVPAAAAKRSAR